MILPVSGSRDGEGATPEAVAEAVAALDGRRRYSVRLVRDDGVTLRLYRTRTQAIYADLAWTVGGTEVSRHSERALSEAEAVRAALAFRIGEEAWPRLMAWNTDEEMSPRERARTIRRSVRNPVRFGLGTFALTFPGAWLVLFDAVGGGRLVFGGGATIVHDGIVSGALAAVVALVVALGTVVYWQRQADG